MLLSFLAASLLAPKLNFYADGPYDPVVPRPESILGYNVGDRHTTFREQEMVDFAIMDKAKDRVKMFTYGKSGGGRPLRVYAISSPKNIARLDQIRQEHQDLANGKGDPSKTPAIVWINECIHGNETASFESGMWALYNLAASRGSLAKALENTVVILNPVYNPDGHERYVVYYNSVAVGSSDRNAFEMYEPGVVYGRLNQYRFDMNRDRVAFSQDETKAEFAEFLQWSPQVYVDQHGQVGSYFFPPEPMSINSNVDRARVNHWNDVFGRATGQAFDEHGFQYFVKDTFDLYYPGYLDASTTLSGAIGMTHETDGGRLLNSPRADGSVVTLLRGIEKHFTSALAVVKSAADHKDELVKSYADFKKRAVEGTLVGKFQRVVVESQDPRPLRRLQNQLWSAGIHSGFAANAFTQPDANDYWSAGHGSHTFPAGSLVVDLAQPQAAMAKALLEPQSNFEEQFVKEQVAKKKSVSEGEKYPGAEGAEFYDFTGWALPYAHNLAAWWCESRPEVALTQDRVELIKQSPLPKEEKERLIKRSQVKPLPASTVGYALPYQDQDDALAAFDALSNGVRAMVTSKPMTLNGVTYAYGTFLFLADRNEDDYVAKLNAIIAKRNVQIVPLTTSFPDAETRQGPGSESTTLLKVPKIAVVMGQGANLFQSGPMWFLMEKVFKLPFTPISANALTNGDLSKYTCIVLPAGAQGSASGKFKEWLNAGGCVLSFGNLDWAVGSDKLVELTKGKDDPQDLPGSLFRAKLDLRSFLSYGYSTDTISVPISGNDFYAKRKEGGSVVTLSDDEKVTKLLTGWSWPDDTEKKLKGTVWLQDVPVGRGHAILFTQDPTERAMWPGLYKLILNGMLIGSGS